MPRQRQPVRQLYHADAGRRGTESLSYYLPGYRVTFLETLVGFEYAFVAGYAMGRASTSLPNHLVGGAD